MDSLCMDGSEVAACICTNRSSPTCCCRLINQSRLRSSAQPAECRPVDVAGLSRCHVDRQGAPGSGVRPARDGCCLLSDGRALPEQHGPRKQTVRVVMGPESLRQVWASRLRPGGRRRRSGPHGRRAESAESGDTALQPWQRSLDSHVSASQRQPPSLPWPRRRGGSGRVNDSDGKSVSQAAAMPARV